MTEEEEYRLRVEVFETPQPRTQGRSLLRCVTGNDIRPLTNLAEVSKMAKSVIVYTQPG
jgi:hypothetical protein